MSDVTRRNPITTEAMTPLMSGDYAEVTYAAYEWRCDGCGLVWAKKHQAAGCEARGHVPRWEQGPYGVTHVENGVPQGNLRWYTRLALRRERLEVSR